MKPWLSCLLACGVALCAGSCDSTDDGSSGGGSGKNSTNPDSGAASVDNPDEINDNCPANDIGPREGPFGLKGDCCYRTSNKARLVESEAAAERTLEFRLPYFMLINHLSTIDPVIIGPTGIERFDNEEQNVLVRFVLPQKDGELVKGKGKLKIGPGRYNCDGTYSFYSERAAPTSSGAADRWFVPEIELDVTNPEAKDRSLVTAPFKKSLATQNRASFLPYLTPTFELDWEGQSQGFDFLEMPIGEDNYDCVGERDGSKWKAGGKSVAFGRLDTNDRDMIDALGITFCQLMAFGSGAGTCENTKRCMPGEQGCLWKRLPDSLCPTSDEDKAKWGCHLGYADNPDNAPLEPNCSEDPPGDTDIDPDNGTKEGQCCDPLGREDSKLPACNAWAQINEFVAAAVEITDKTSDELQESCRGK